MSTPVEISPSSSEPGPSHKRLLSRWSLAATGGALAVLLLLLIWQCGTALRDKGRANAAVRRFHEQLDNGQYEDIYREADPDLAPEGKHDELMKLLGTIHAKLGSTGYEKLLYVGVQTNTSGGTFTVARYETNFVRGSALETFTWKRHGGGLKLCGYNIQSNALLE